MTLLFPVLACLFLGLGLFGLRRVRTTGFEHLVDELAADEPEEKAPPGPGPFVRLADWLGLRYHRTLVRLWGPQRMADLDRLLDRAGRPEGMTALDFMRREAGLIAIGVFAVALMGLAGNLLSGVALLVVLAAMLPLWLRTAAARRQETISRELPDFLDVLAVTVAAGQSLQSAMERVAEADERPLSVELQRVLEDLRLGMSRRAALAALRDRNDSSAVASWVTAMLQAEELGAPLSAALNDIAADIRREAAQLVRRKAARMGPKVSLVVTLVIMPAALLLILASLILSNVSSLGSLGGLFG
ncbi:MAG: type II secretion system F family protein [Propionibacteriaceae bacterium]|jgi:tight adherence protein C|nr:type II secretion system F family protein [Propionibacteriaceae bacterium]